MTFYTGDCFKFCLETCRNSGSFERGGKSCEISCDSVTEDCEDGYIRKSMECKTERERNKKECPFPPCSTETKEITCERSESCEKLIVPTGGFNHGRERYGILCEIRDPHHRRQLKRLARMRSRSSGTVLTSHVDVLRPISHHQDRVATQNLYNLLVTRSPDSENKQVMDLVKRPLGSKLSRTNKNRRHRKERKQIYWQARKRPASKFSDGKLIRKTTIHRTEGIAPFHHSQTKRISEKKTKFISA